MGYRREPLFSCIPDPELIQTNNVTVFILKKKVCDGHDDCLNGVDEMTCERSIGGTTEKFLNSKQWYTIPYRHPIHNCKLDHLLSILLPLNKERYITLSSVVLCLQTAYQMILMYLGTVQ